MRFTAFDMTARIVGGLSFLTLMSCGRLVTECGGTSLNISRLTQIQRAAFTSNTQASLIIPNPLDATGNIGIQSMDSSLINSLSAIFLPNLSTVGRLENNFLKIRINSINDSPEILATPNSNGQYAFPITDIHYGETMAYHSMNAIQSYVEALGFQTNKSRPLFVMVNATGSTNNPEEVNAFYSHNYFDTTAPRTLKIYGDTAFSPRQDRDIYWHEFGHYLLESITSDRGVDFAGDSGAMFSEGAAIHECIADYGAESLSGRGYLGRWIARNFSEFAAGQPLRSAEDKNDELNNFSKVATFDATTKNLDRYRIGEWCTRVLWDIRRQIVKENSDEGRFYADRMIFAAASLLKRDTSVTSLRGALLEADEQLNCGIHSQSVKNAFESRGFSSDIPNLDLPLKLKASIVWLRDEQGQLTREFSISFTLTNPNLDRARNVRLILESTDARISPVVYQQSYGDLGSGKTVTVGGNGSLPIDYSVVGSVAPNQNYQGAHFNLRIKSENAPDAVIPGVL